nr:MAG TPA: hypothetical protein [Caudoviricetes sp.]
MNGLTRSNVIKVIHILSCVLYVTYLSRQIKQHTICYVPQL